jgi:dethiobiotin synthetase
MIMRQAKSIFITGTDTDVGKTLVSGLLLRFLRRQGTDAGYQKWVATGGAENPADLAACLRLAGLAPDPALLDLRVPYRFSQPFSPHLAAELDQREIDPEKIVAAYRALAARYEVLIVEGVGGLLVPLRRDLLLVDLLGRLRIPTIIVARSGLGAINHALLTIEALRARRIPAAGVIFTDVAAVDERLAADNIRTIAALGQVNILGRLPYRPEQHELLADFAPIGAKISALLARQVP